MELQSFLQNVCSFQFFLCYYQDFLIFHQYLNLLIISFYFLYSKYFSIALITSVALIMSKHLGIMIPFSDNVGFKHKLLSFESPSPSGITLERQHPPLSQHDNAPLV